MDAFRPVWRTILISLLLSALTLAVFFPLLRSDFIKLDDLEYVKENPHIQDGLSWKSAKWAFQTAYASNWHPLTWLSHAMDVQLFGLRPGWHHLTNILFHTANSVLLFLLLFRMTGKQVRSAMVAALFALHPLHVESVAWISERKDVLSTFFLLLTIWAYTRYVAEKHATRSTHHEQTVAKGPTGYSNLHQPVSRQAGPYIYYFLSLALFALGLMSKPMLVTLPFLLMLLDYWPLRRFEPGSEKSKLLSLWPLLMEKLPFLVLAVSSSVVTFLAQRGAMTPSASLPLGARIANAIVSYWRYLGKTLWPEGLAIFYPHPQFQGSHLAVWQVSAAAFLLAAVSIIAIMRRRKSPWLFTGWFWYLGMLVPVIGIVQVGLQAIADRYTYTPLIGIFICAVWGCSEALALWPFGKQLLPVIGAAIVALCTAVTYRQVGYWRNNLTVFEHALAVTQRNSVAHYNLGVEFASRQQYDLAIPQYRASLKLNPADPYACIGLAIALNATGKTAEAIEQYEASLRIEPNNERAHNNLGVLLLAVGKPQEALEHYHEALRLKTDYAQPHYNLGYLLASRGELQEAEEHFSEALKLKPDYVEALRGLGNVLIMQRRFPEAQAQFQEMVRRSPADAEAHAGLGETLRRQRKLDEALVQFAEAVRLDPNQSVAHFNMGTILFDRGSFADAESHFAAVLRQNPADAEARAWLAKTQAKLRAPPPP